MNELESAYAQFMSKMGVKSLKPSKKDFASAPKDFVPPVELLNDDGQAKIAFAITKMPSIVTPALLQIRIADAPEHNILMSVGGLQMLIEALIAMESQYEDYCFEQAMKQNSKKNEAR